MDSNFVSASGGWDLSENFPSDHIRFDLEKRLQDARVAYRSNGIDTAMFYNYIRALRNFHEFCSGGKIPGDLWT
jgi:hypothetical protein